LKRGGRERDMRRGGRRRKFKKPFHVDPSVKLRRHQNSFLVARRKREKE